MTIPTDVLAISPFAAAVLLAAAILLVDFAFPGRRVPALVTTFIGLALVGALVAGIPATVGATNGSVKAFDSAYSIDPLTTFLDLLFVAIVALTVAFAPDYLEERDLPVAEFAAVLVFAMSGAMLIAGSADLLVLFLGLELMVLPGYMLVGFAKRDALATEGAIKYFLLGSFSSAIFLFGLAFTWGLTGSTRVDDVARYLANVMSGGASLSAGLAMGLAFMTTGVAFKIAAVPFHYWTPDAYQGSPTPVTGYLSVGPKIAAFALILRLFVDALGGLKADWTPFIVVLAAATMTLGNLVAVGQDNIKRMLAYSSIAHTGYILVGLAAFGAAPVGSPAEQAGLQAVLFYSVAYSFMNLGAFAVVAALQRRPGVTSQLTTFAGLGRRAPLLAALMLLFLLSLTGIPPLAGFWAKWYVIQSALQVGGWLTLLAVLTVLNAAVAAFYYLRVAVYMYMREPADAAPAVELGGQTRVGLALAALGTVAIGLVPPVTIAVITVAQQAAQALL
jgi:NADH-quinone oxidoreductase subunit N